MSRPRSKSRVKKWATDCFVYPTRFESGLLLIAFSAVVTRIVFRLTLPLTGLYPDENTYGRLATWIFEGNDNTKFPGYDVTPFYGAQALIMPSVWQMKIFGIEGLDAVRNISLIYGIGCISILFYIARFYIRQNLNFKESKFNRRRVFLALFYLGYCFLPSHFLWSVTALRESSSEFFLLLSGLLLIGIFKSPSWLLRFVYSLSLLLSISLQFQSRFQTAWIACLSLAFVSFFSLFTSKKRPELIAVGMCAFFAGSYLITIPAEVVQKEIEVSENGEKVVFMVEAGKVIGVLDKRVAKTSPKPMNGKTAQVTVSDQLVNLVTEAQKNGTEISETQLNNLIDVQTAEGGQTAEGIATNNQKIKVKEIENKVQQKNIKDNAIKPAQSVSTTESSREVKRVGAESAIPEVKCILAESEGLAKHLCELQTLPMKWFQFMFGPFIFNNELSSDAKKASIENLLWFALFGFLILSWLRYRFKISLYESFPTFFLLSYSSAAALVEGNYGTAFRHRSILLGLVIWLIFAILTPSYQSIHSSARLRKNLTKNK